ncbi:MAG: hypothetical protein A2905_01600 [Candidatus Levybacteria bacterium RIFCSPLOWO2_01_FULL_36_10]|nr:MAG: hypothetical protein A2905_01600 [Candidatus Levybacteria bacterium RIFCSPLOWO2_01_FULL_36_10]
MNIKNTLLRLFSKLSIFTVLLALNFIPVTNSAFTSQASISGNIVSTGCWSTPSVPVLLSPADETTVSTIADQTFTWNSSTSMCPDADISYKFKAFKDSSLTDLYADSGWISDASFMLTQLPEGAYYWQVKAKDQYGYESAYSLPWLLTVQLPVVTPPAINQGDVVINELMWMGSDENSNDEWLELRNMTSQQIDISGWQITALVGGNTETLIVTIPSGYSISANGLFLITRLSKAASAINVDPDIVDSGLVLRNSDLQIKLYKGLWTDSGNLIDTADDSNNQPFHGVNGTNNKRSMERDDIPGNGALVTSWHTCNDQECNDTTYWDVEGNDFGTPKAANLSENEKNPSLSMQLSEDAKTLTFTVNNIKDFEKLSYTLTYDTDTVAQGVSGLVDLDKQEELGRDIILGTCSSGGICAYHSDIGNIKLHVELQDKKGNILQLNNSYL